MHYAKYIWNYPRMGKSMLPHQRLRKRNYKQRIIRKYEATEKNLRNSLTLKEMNKTVWGNFIPVSLIKPNTVFPSDELLLLNKSIRCNLSYKHKNLIRTLALGAERQLLINYPDLNKSIWDIRVQIIQKSI
jgi:hypothetical protein